MESTIIKLERYWSMNCGVETVTAHNDPTTGSVERKAENLTTGMNPMFVPRVKTNMRMKGRMIMPKERLFRLLKMRYSANKAKSETTDSDTDQSVVKGPPGTMAIALPA